MEDLFPHKPGVDYSRLRMTPQGLYSVTRRRDGERMMAFLQSAIPDMSSKTITDATACVGSDTLRFSLACKQVHAIEWKQDTASVLEHNLGVFGATNVSVHIGNATKILNWKTDVLYIDPPWGGPDYYKIPKLDLFMGKERVDVWIERLLKQSTRPDFVVLKVPRNYNFAHLQFLAGVSQTRMYRVRNFMVVVLSTS